MRLGSRSSRIINNITTLSRFFIKYMATINSSSDLWRSRYTDNSWMVKFCNRLFSGMLIHGNKTTWITDVSALVIFLGYKLSYSVIPWPYKYSLLFYFYYYIFYITYLFRLIKEIWKFYIIKSLYCFLLF